MIVSSVTKYILVITIGNRTAGRRSRAWRGRRRTRVPTADGRRRSRRTAGGGWCAAGQPGASGGATPWAAHGYAASTAATRSRCRPQPSSSSVSTLASPRQPSVVIDRLMFFSSSSYFLVPVLIPTLLCPELFMFECDAVLRLRLHNFIIFDNIRSWWNYLQKTRLGSSDSKGIWSRA